jgi:hypothetical protein
MTSEASRDHGGERLTRRDSLCAKAEDLQRWEGDHTWRNSNHRSDGHASGQNGVPCCALHDLLSLAVSLSRGYKVVFFQHTFPAASLSTLDVTVVASDTVGSIFNFPTTATAFRLLIFERG